MNLPETGLVLAKIQAYSNRNFDKAAITAWHELLNPYTAADCQQAVTDHYRESKDWIMPADIIQRVHAYRRARINALPDGLKLSDADIDATDTGADYAARLKQLNNLIGDGHLTPDQHQTYLVHNLTLETAARQELTP